MGLQSTDVSDYRFQRVAMQAALLLLNLYILETDETNEKLQGKCFFYKMNEYTGYRVIDVNTLWGGVRDTAAKRTAHEQKIEHPAVFLFPVGYFNQYVSITLPSREVQIQIVRNWKKR